MATLVLLALVLAGVGTRGPTGPVAAAAQEAPKAPDVTYFVVAFHWGWAVFDETGRELDAIRVAEGTTVELYAMNDAAEEAIAGLPAPVAAAIGAIEFDDGERNRRAIAEGRLPDPQLVLGMSLEEVMGRAAPTVSAHIAAWQTPWHGEGELETHGFLIPWYGVAEKLEPDAGEPVRVVFTADRPGGFEFICTVYCGFGHQYQMREMLFVEAAE